MRQGIYCQQQRSIQNGFDNTTCLGKLDVVAFIDAKIDPIENQVVRQHVAAELFNDEETSVALSVHLFLPALAEGGEGLSGEFLAAHLEWATLFSALEDGNKLLNAIRSLGLESVGEACDGQLGMVYRDC